MFNFYVPMLVQNKIIMIWLLWVNNKSFKTKFKIKMYAKLFYFNTLKVWKEVKCPAWTCPSSARSQQYLN